MPLSLFAFADVMRAFAEFFFKMLMHVTSGSPSSKKGRLVRHVHEVRGLLRELRPSFVRSEPRKKNDHATASRGGSNTIVSETSRENDDNYDDVDEGGGTAGEQAMQGRQQLLENTKATPMKTTTTETHFEGEETAAAALDKVVTEEPLDEYEFTLMMLLALDKLELRPGLSRAIKASHIEALRTVRRQRQRQRQR